nr:cytosine deaminase [Quercus suber]
MQVKSARRVEDEDAMEVGRATFVVGASSEKYTSLEDLLVMAAEYLHGHGIDLSTELSKLPDDFRPSGVISSIVNATLPMKPRGSTWDVAIENGRVRSIHPSRELLPDGDAPPAKPSSHTVLDCSSSLVTPSLCHPHIHLDKAFLLSHPSFNDIQVQSGDFAEAMELTSKAKSHFQHADLIERGQRVIDESVAAGVTHMRAFVEVDAGVGMKCLEAGLELKRSAELARTCVIQICAFAQLPLFSESPGDADGAVIRGLIRQAAGTEGVDAVGSTPYVEASQERMKENIRFMVDLTMQHNAHLDFHLDYNLDRKSEPMIWHVLHVLREKQWPQDRTVVLGHCTRLTFFSNVEWRTLKETIGSLPVSFVGLPTSDLYMMRTPDYTRGTLKIPDLIQEHHLNACIGMNNIGNAFTPYGSCDPVTLACNGVGIYQAGKEQDAELLYACVSTRAKEAIGLGRSGPRGSSGPAFQRTDLEIRIGDPADLLVYDIGISGWRTRRTLCHSPNIPIRHLLGSLSIALNRLDHIKTGRCNELLLYFYWRPILARKYGRLTTLNLLYYASAVEDEASTRVISVKRFLWEWATDPLLPLSLSSSMWVACTVQYNVLASDCARSGLCTQQHAHHRATLTMSSAFKHDSSHSRTTSSGLRCSRHPSSLSPVQMVCCEALLIDNVWCRSFASDRAMEGENDC